MSARVCALKLQRFHQGGALSKHIGLVRSERQCTVEIRERSRAIAESDLHINATRQDGDIIRLDLQRSGIALEGSPTFMNRSVWLLPQTGTEK
jgi:hypothetical protein